MHCSTHNEALCADSSRHARTPTPSCIQKTQHQCTRALIIHPRRAIAPGDHGITSSDSSVRSTHSGPANGAARRSRPNYT
eukprot:10442899-Prorocentrum_lima.AAC.1